MCERFTVHYGKGLTVDTLTYAEKLKKAGVPKKASQCSR